MTAECFKQNSQPVPGFVWRTLFARKCCVLNPGKYAHPRRITQSVYAERRKDGLALTTVWWVRSKQRVSATCYQSGRYPSSAGYSCEIGLCATSIKVHFLPPILHLSLLFPLYFYKEKQRQMLPFCKAMSLMAKEKADFLEIEIIPRTTRGSPKTLTKTFRG